MGTSSSNAMGKTSSSAMGGKIVGISSSKVGSIPNRPGSYSSSALQSASDSLQLAKASKVSKARSKFMASASSNGKF